MIAFHNLVRIPQLRVRLDLLLPTSPMGRMESVLLGSKTGLLGRKTGLLGRKTGLLGRCCRLLGSHGLVGRRLRLRVGFVERMRLLCGSLCSALHARRLIQQN